MLDPDISTTDAVRHLSRAVANDDPFSIDRRRFLQAVGMGLGAGLVAGPGTSLLDAALPGHDPSAWALGPIGPTDGVLVVIGMYGGNDGLNTVVPINDGRYYDQHGSLAIPAGQTLPLDATQRPASRPGRTQALLGRRSARDRRGCRPHAGGVQPLQLDGEVDVGSTDGAHQQRVARPVARRVPRREQGSVRCRRGRPFGPAAHDRRAVDRHHGADRSTELRCAARMAHRGGRGIVRYGP